MERTGRRPTLADVALLAGTSTAVVSYVVNDGPRAVAPATRARVERAIQELGYRWNPIAGALSVGHSKLVGLLVPDTANGFFGELSRCFEGEGRRRGLMTLLGNTGYDPAVADDYVFAFSDLRPRGIFVTSVGSAALPDDARLVFVHSAPPDTSAASVRFDDFGAATAAVEHLLAHGYRDIHCVSGVRDGGPASDREDGWRRAVRDAGLETAGRLHRTSFERVAAEADVRPLLAGPDRPRAIFAATDEQALAVLRAAAMLGVRVPDELAVVAVDGIREAVLGGIRLTTVRLPLDELARRALDLLDEPVDGEPTRIVLGGELVVGDSCGCAGSGL